MQRRVSHKVCALLPCFKNLQMPLHQRSGTFTFLHSILESFRLAQKRSINLPQPHSLKQHCRTFASIVFSYSQWPLQQLIDEWFKTCRELQCALKQAGLMSMTSAQIKIENNLLRRFLTVKIHSKLAPESRTFGRKIQILSREQIPYQLPKTVWVSAAILRLKNKKFQLHWHLLLFSRHLMWARKSYHPAIQQQNPRATAGAKVHRQEPVKVADIPWYCMRTSQK